MTEHQADQLETADADLQGLVAFLAELYEDQDAKPYTFAELVEELPALGPELELLESRGMKLFGEPIQRYLRSQGVLASEKPQAVVKAAANDFVEAAASEIEYLLLEQHASENAFLEEARRHAVSASLLVTAIDTLTEAFDEAKEVMSAAWRDAYLQDTEQPTAEGAYLEQMRGVAMVERHALPYLQRMLDAFGTQQQTGSSPEVLAAIARAIKDFDAHALAGLAQVDYADSPIVEHAAIFTETDVLRNTKTALRYVVSNYLDCTSPRKGSSIVPGVMTHFAMDGLANALTSVQVANLQRREANLLGLDLDIYRLIRKLGGSVDLSTIKEELSIPKDTTSIYLYHVMPLVKEGLLVESTERMPFTYEGERSQRFYTWWQRDTNGEPRVDREAYHQWLRKRLEALSHREKIDSLSRSRSAFIAKVRECDPDDTARQNELRAEIADIDECINRLNVQAEAHKEAIAKLDEAMDALKQSEGFSDLARR